MTLDEFTAKVADVQTLAALAQDMARDGNVPDAMTLIRRAKAILETVTAEGVVEEPWRASQPWPKSRRQ